VPLATLYVPANDNTHGDAQINDKRVWVIAQTVFNVKDYGVVGDGSTDDTAAINAVVVIAAAAAPSTLVFPAATYRVIDNLFPHGQVDWIGIGQATIELDANPTRIDYWICGGITKYGSTPGDGIEPWNGKVENLTFSCTVNVTTVSRSFNVFNTAGLDIVDCVFDVTATGTNSVGGIGIYNNGNYSNPNTKSNIRILHNNLYASQATSGSEAIGVGDLQYVWIQSNYMAGWGDDPIGVHTCQDFTVSHNKCWSVDGRIYVSGSKRGLIDNNYNERTAAIGGGALLYLGIEAIEQPACQDITVSNNILVHHASTPSATYGIKADGASRCTIIGNQVYDESGYGRLIEVLAIDYAGWTDPDDQEPDTIMRVREVTIAGNMATGDGARANGSGELFVSGPGDSSASVPGPVLIVGNRVKDMDTWGKSYLVGNHMEAYRGVAVLDVPFATSENFEDGIFVAGHAVAFDATEEAGSPTLDWTHGVVNVESTGGVRAVTLPDNAAFSGKNYLIRRDGGNNVTVTRAGSDTFDDAATVKTLASDGAAIGIFSIGDGVWKIVGIQGTVT